MAGRGRAATLPAWMTAGGAGAMAPAAPGAPAAAGAPAPTGVPAPGSAGLMPGLAPSNQPQGQTAAAPLAGVSRAPMMVPSGLSPAPRPAAPSPTAPPGGGAMGQPDTAAMAAAALAAAKAAALAAGIQPQGGPGAPAAAGGGGGGPVGGLMQQPGGAGQGPAAAPGGLNFGAPSPTAAVRPAAAPPGNPPMGGPPGGMGMGPPPGAYPGMPPPGMFQPPPGMMPPAGMVPPGMPPFGPPPGMPPFGAHPGMFPPHMAPPHMQPPPMQQHAAPQQQQQPQQPQQPKSDWTEHTAPDGKRKYYFNSKTQQSTWVRPDELMTPEERAKAAADKNAAAAAAAVASAPAVAAKPDAAASGAAAAAAGAAAPAAGGHSAADIAKAWKQYTAPDGRPYYHNKLTKQSKWVMPDEMKQAQAAGSSEPAAAAGGSGSAKPPPTQVVPLSANGVEGGKASAKEPAAAPREPAKPVVYPNKEAAKEAFKQLLQDFDVPPEASWDNTMRLIIHDVRYAALKAMGEKKAAFNEYCTARRAAEREEARKRQIAAKEGFMTLLEECAELKPGDSYDRAVRLLNHDNRWKDVDSDALRRELFKDHINALKRRRVEEEKQQKETAVAAYRALLERSNLKASSTWRKMQNKLADTEEYEALDRVTRLEVFQEVVRGLEEQERQEREKEKEAKRRQERRNRDSFRQLLQQHREEGRINVRSRWKEYGPTVEEDPLYVAVKKNTSGSRPKELFEDLIVELEEEYDRARPILKDALRAANWVATPDSTYTDYLEALSGGGGDEQQQQQEPAAAADKAPGGAEGVPDGAEGGEDGDGDAAMADAEKQEKEGKGRDKVGGRDGGLAAKVAAIRDSHKRVYYEEQVGRAKEKIAEAEKKKKRALDKFVSFVRTAEGLYASTTWEEFEEAFKDEEEFVAVGPEAARQVFEEHIEKLKSRDKDRKHRDEDDEGSGKKKKRSSRHDDDDHKKSKRHKRDRSRERSKDKDRSRGRSKDKERSRERSKDRSKDRKRGRTPDSGSEEGEV